MTSVFKSIFYAVLVFASPLASSFESYTKVGVDDLSLNRTGSKLTGSELDEFNPAHIGFTWNSGDDSTLKWMPQGITSLYTEDDRHFVIASWYGVASQGYANRGVRLSFADVTDLENGVNPKYRHVLLVDEEGETFYGMHGGGIAYKDGEIHVGDTRTTPKVHVFPISDIRAIPSSDLGSFYNYGYAIVKSRTYDIPFHASYISYNEGEFTYGTFSQCAASVSYGCFVDESDIPLDDPIYTYEEVNPTFTNESCPTHFCSIQGAVTYGNETWISSSYGRSNASFLRVAYASGSNCYSDENSMVFEFEMPSGLEDLHLDPQTGYLWGQTEFGSRQGSYSWWGLNHRRVFAIDRGTFSFGG